MTQKTVDTQWFEHDRFGLFIHWGLYAIPGKGEWYPSIEKVETSGYEKYSASFNPVGYNPKQWAKMAKQAGMRYAVLTAKHHDGFCLFDTEYTNFNATKTPAGRDLVREYVDAFRQEGLKVGLYYSLVDWHHPHYPAYDDPYHPMRNRRKIKDEHRNFELYLDYMHAQVKELCSNYGKIDILWFDFSYDEFAGEKWRASELVSMVRSLQPHILLNSRLEASGGMLGSLLTQTPTPWAGDFVTPEQTIPPHPLTRTDGTPVCWEACQTMNNSFGYTFWDNEYKTAATCIRQLVDCVSKGGNYLLNVGPDANGNIPEKSAEILDGIGRWMGLNHESIYGCGNSQIEVSAFGCRCTMDESNRLFIHVMQQPVGPLAIKGILPKDIRRAWLLASGTDVEVLQHGWAIDNYPEYTFISLAKQENESLKLEDSNDTVIVLELTQK